MTLRLYPKSRRDRNLFWISVLNTALAIFLTALGGIWVAVLCAFAAAFNFVLVYAFPDKEQGPETDEYSRMIDQLSRMGSQLTDLGSFLDRERRRVADTEDTLSRLRDEKSQLEPIVTTKRETVDAILAAYSSRVRSTVWKDRVLGFTIGVVSSLIATMIFELIKR